MNDRTVRVPKSVSPLAQEMEGDPVEICVTSLVTREAVDLINSLADEPPPAYPPLHAVEHAREDKDAAVLMTAFRLAHFLQMPQARVIGARIVNQVYFNSAELARRGDIFSEVREHVHRASALLHVRESHVASMIASKGFYC